MSDVNTRALRMVASVELDDRVTADGEPKPRTFRLEPAYSGGVMAQPWAKRVVADLDGMSIDAPDGELRALAHHDLAQWAGVIRAENIRKVDGQLHAHGELFDEGDATADMVVLKGKKAKWQASIGADIDWDAVETVKAGESCRVNNQSFEGPLLILRKTSLYEISFTPIGADRATSAAVFAARTQPEEVAEVADPTTPDALAAYRARIQQITAEFSADAEFLSAALQGDDDIATLRLAYTKKLSAAKDAELAAVRAELEAAKADLAKPRVSASGLGGQTPAAESPQQTFERLVKAEMARLREDQVPLMARSIPSSANDRLRVMAASNVSQTPEGKAAREAWIAQVNS